MRNSVMLTFLCIVTASYVWANEPEPASKSPVKERTITATHLGVAETRKAADTITPEFRIPANNLALIWIASDNWEQVGEPTGLSDKARKWTKVAMQDARNKGMTLWQSLEPKESSSTVTISHSGATRIN